MELEWVFVLIVVLAVIGIFGLGIWTLLAAIYHAIRGQPPVGNPVDRIHCPSCGLKNPASERRCQWCGKLLKTESTGEAADLAALRRQLARLHEAGVMDAAAVQDLLARVTAYERERSQPGAIGQAAHSAEIRASSDVGRIGNPSGHPADIGDGLPIRPTGGPAVPSPFPAASTPRSPQTQPGTPPAAPPAACPPVPPPHGQEATQGILVAELVPEATLAPPIKAPAILSTGVEQSGPVSAPPLGIQPAAAAAPLGPQRKPSAPPRPPRKSWMEVVAEFLEERHIRLAEVILVLVAGLLIVGGSVAVVISFWSEMQNYLKFSVFVGISSAVFGLGLITFHRWKLEITGRGLLMIATLLTPLNFLALASLAPNSPWASHAQEVPAAEQDPESPSPESAALSPGAEQIATIAAEFAALAIFVYLVGLASHVLVPGRSIFLILAVVGNSAAVLIVARLTGEIARGWPMTAAGLLPVAIYAGAVGGYSRHCPRRERFDAVRTNGLFFLLGAAVFALAMPLGLLIAKSAAKDGLPATLEHVAPLVALAAMPILSVGLMVVRRVARDAAMAAHRTAGSAVGLAAAALLIAALGLAWPRPVGLLAVGLLDCAMLLYVAVRDRLTIAHGGAIAAAAIVYLLGFHLASGNLPWDSSATSGRQILQLALTARSGTALMGLFALLAAAGGWLARHGMRRHAVQYAGGCGAVGLMSLLLVTVDNLYTRGANSMDATVVYAIYGVCSFYMAARWQRTGLAYLGLGLLAGSTLWGLWWTIGKVTPIWGTILAAEALGMGLAAALVLERNPFGSSRGVSRTREDVADVRSTGFSRNPGEEPPKGGTTNRGFLAAGGIYRLPLLCMAEVVGGLALVFGVWTGLDWRHSTAPIVTAACLTGVELLAAWGFRSAQRTYAASLVVLLGLSHTFAVNYPELVERPWGFALLAHATLAVLSRLVASIATKRKEIHSAIRGLFVEPLATTAMATSGLVLPVLLILHGGGWLALAGDLTWLGAIWLMLAWMKRWPALVSAGQAVFTLAALAATTAWIESHPWNATGSGGFGVDFSDPRTFQAYGIGLALLTLAWAVVRLALRSNNIATREVCSVILSEAKDLGKLGRFFAALRMTDGAPRCSSFGSGHAWIRVDVAVGYVVLVGQFLVAAGSALVACRHELIQAGPLATAQLVSFGQGAWTLLGILALVFLIGLWDRWREGEVLGALLIGVTVTYLIAGRFAADFAAASALRWTLSLGFVALAGMIGQRNLLRRVCLRAGARLAVGRGGLIGSHAIALVFTAIPVVALTLVAAFLQLNGVPHGGPAAASIFRLDPSLSYLVPLLLVMAGLIGLAVRESAAGYAFSAGLVAELTVVLGYVLHVAALTATELVTILQLATVTAATWAIAWLAARQRINVWREVVPCSDTTSSGAEAPDGYHGQLAARGEPTLADKPPVAPLLVAPVANSSGVLMDAQIGMAVFGNAMVILPALLALALWQGGPWTMAAGSPWGWIALALAVAAVVYRSAQTGRRLQPELAGLVGMAALGLLACTVRAVLPAAPEWGYRTLMLGWATYALFVVAATWWIASLRAIPGAAGPPQALIRAAAGWVAASGILAVLLGLKAALFYNVAVDLLWAAAAIAIASGACATMAVWRRGEGWAFAAAPGVNLAASLVVWYAQTELFLQDGWVLLVQANVIASAVVALAWLAARKRLYELRDFTVRTSPLLAVQTLLGVIDSGILWIPGVTGVVLDPSQPFDFTPQLAGPAGWMALFVAAAAAAWYLRQVSPRDLVHVAAGFGLGAGVLLMSAAVRWNGLASRDPWIAYHVLESVWAAVGLLMLPAGMLGRNLRMAGQVDPTVRRPATERVLSSSEIQAWVTVIGAAVLGLALFHTQQDPMRPWWSVGAILAVSLAAGVLAMWLRLPEYVFLSGLMVNVTATVMWLSWGPHNLPALAAANAIALAIASCGWSLVHAISRAGVPRLPIGRNPLAFTQLAAETALALVAGVAMVVVACDLYAIEHPAAGQLSWIALAATALAILTLLWDGSARFVLPSLYLAGVTGVVFGLDARGLAGQPLIWASACELSVYGLGVALLAETLWRLGFVWKALRIPLPPDRWPTDWLPTMQTFVVGGAGLAAIWISIDPAFDQVGYPNLAWHAGRIAGPAASVLLFFASVLTARRCRPLSTTPDVGRIGNLSIHQADLQDGLPIRPTGKPTSIVAQTVTWRTGWQWAVLALGLLVQSEFGWALLNPEIPVPYLHRSVILMVSTAVMTLVAGFGIERSVRSGSDWIAAGRRAAPWLAGLTLATLAAVLVQEFEQYVPDLGTPLAMPAAIVVGAALAGLVGGCLACAVTPRLDPFGLSDRGRQAYVYAAEVLILIIVVHLRLTLPDLFRWHILMKYWMLMVMGAAFAGAALSELFHRRGMPVLSEPLQRSAMLLPLAPALGFWVSRLHEHSGWPLAAESPAVWFLAAVFYAFLAFTRRSERQTVVFTLLSLLAANVGIGVAWRQLSPELFWSHPQTWLIPIGLSLLLAEYLNHNRLTAAQSAGLRYLALSVIYVPASAEHLRDLGRSIWLPLTLILLSLAGVMAGIVFRIRSFLYLGVTFLAFVIVTMIRYAAVDLHKTWVLYICCIVLGVVIFAVVGFYEKRRVEIHAAIKRFKQWQR